jgi:DNA invertase Pin-like site-specific DNA recombinase
MPVRTPGISYSRFSDPKQADGDSESRQEEMYREFCTRHNLTPVREVFVDRGRSGYKDEHRKKGRLGELIAMAKDDRFEPGTVIVIEAWDRLGRLRPDRQTELVAELLRTGVRIGICRLDDIFSEDDFGTHKWTTLAVFIQLAYQESKQKADRIARSWKKRRERAREDGELLSSRLPAWLEYVDGEARPIPERVAAIKRILRLAAEGFGQTRIAGVLTKEGIPAFGEVVIREGRTRSQFSGKWLTPYIKSILSDRRILGEFQPYIGDKPDGPPIMNYFPPVATEQEFLLAQAGIDARRNTARRGPGGRESRYVNVFRSLLTDARDGEGILLHNMATSARPRLCLVNASGNGGRGRNWSFPYHVFETAVLRLLREIDPRDVMPKADHTPNRAGVLKAELDGIRSDIARYKEDLRGGYSKYLTEMLREKETDEENKAQELQEELAKSVRPAEAAWREFPGVVDLLAEADDPVAARLRVRTVLARIVERMVVLMVRRGAYSLCAVQAHFTTGGRRDFLVVSYAAGFNRQGWWKAKSLADVVALGDFDLREEKDASNLQRALEALTPEDLARVFAG